MVPGMPGIGGSGALFHSPSFLPQNITKTHAHQYDLKPTYTVQPHLFQNYAYSTKLPDPSKTMFATPMTYTAKPIEPSQTSIDTVQLGKNWLGYLHIFVTGGANKGNAFYAPHGEKELNRLKNFVLSADPNKMQAPPKSDGFPIQGKTEKIEIDGKLQKVKVEGMDLRGRPVVRTEDGKERVVTDPANASKLSSTNQEPVSLLKKIPEGKIYSPNELFKKSMRSALDQKVVAGVSSIEYMEFMRKEQGIESFALGGCVRDILTAVEANPQGDPKKLIAKVNDIDVTAAAYGAPAKVVFNHFHEKDLADKKVTFYISDRFGTVHWKDKDNPEGFDFNTIKMGGNYDEMVVRVDTAGEGKIPPIKFDHDPLKNAEGLDFCCNALMYDPFNEVIIDPTGFGIIDAQTKFLRLTGGETIEKDIQSAQVAKNEEIHMRFWKFRLRGYTSNQFVTKFILYRAYERWTSIPETKFLADFTKILPIKNLKGTPEEQAFQVNKMIDDLVRVLKEDEVVAYTNLKIADLVEKNREKIVDRMINYKKPAH
jgi:Poly A polymerase head domain